MESYYTNSPQMHSYVREGRCSVYTAQYITNPPHPLCKFSEQYTQQHPVPFPSTCISTDRKTNQADRAAAVLLFFARRLHDLPFLELVADAVALRLGEARVSATEEEDEGVAMMVAWNEAWMLAVWGVVVVVLAEGVVVVVVVFVFEEEEEAADVPEPRADRMPS